MKIEGGYTLDGNTRKVTVIDKADKVNKSYKKWVDLAPPIFTGKAEK